MSTFETNQTASTAPSVPPFSTAEMRSYPLGTLVYRSGLMPLETVNRALIEAADSGRRLGEVLLEYGLAERELTRLLAAQHGQEFVDLTEFPIDMEIVHSLPRTVAEMYCALPLMREGDCTIVAVPDADNASHLTRLREALHGPIRLVTAARSDIKEAIQRVHEPRGPIVEMAMAQAQAVTNLAPEPDPEPEPEPRTVYRVEVTLASGATLLVAEASDFEYAKKIGMRVIDEAEAGGTVAIGDATIDGRQVVSVDVLGRSGA
jgi:Type II secretion system (T2SS), protein E, N-terminal domain